MGKLWTLKLNDWWKGLIVAFITAPLTIAYQSVSTGSLTFDWKAITAAGLTGGIAYLLKNFATGSHGNLLTNNPSKIPPVHDYLKDWQNISKQKGGG